MPSMIGSKVTTSIGDELILATITEQDWDAMEVIIVNEFDDTDMHLVPIAALRFI